MADPFTSYMRLRGGVPRERIEARDRQRQIEHLLQGLPRSQHSRAERNDIAVDGYTNRSGEPWASSEPPYTIDRNLDELLSRLKSWHRLRPGDHRSAI